METSQALSAASSQCRKLSVPQALSAASSQCRKLSVPQALSAASSQCRKLSVPQALSVASSQTKFREFKTIDDLEILDVKAIQGVKYADDPELKRRKQAEILVPDFLKFSEVIEIVVFSKGVKDRLNFILNQAGTKFSSIVYVGRNSWYFINDNFINEEEK